MQKMSWIFTHHLYQIPGNGRHIFLWNDKIIGNDPLNYDISINAIKNWLVNKKLYRLYDIISWDKNGIGMRGPSLICQIVITLFFMHIRNHWCKNWLEWIPFTYLIRTCGVGALLGFILLLMDSRFYSLQRRPNRCPPLVHSTQHFRSWFGIFLVFQK